MGSQIWAAVDKVKNAIDTALTTALGAIPFVGAALAKLVSLLINMVYTKAQAAVNDALEKVSSPPPTSPPPPTMTTTTNGDRWQMRTMPTCAACRCR